MSMSDKALCGKACRSCGYFKLCGGCKTVNCLILRCMNGEKFESLTFPHEICIYSDFCLRSSTYKNFSKVLLKQASSSLNVKKFSIPTKFLPVISLNDKRSWFWPFLKHEIVVVKLLDLIRDRKLRNNIMRIGIHNYLGFDGKVIISTIMPDEILNNLQVGNFIKIIKAIKPDAVMSLDTYTYIDDPLIISWKQTIRAVKNVTFLLEKRGIPIFGIVKGANYQQVKWCLEKYNEIGINKVVIPCREIISHKCHDALPLIMSMAKNYKFDVILYGGPLRLLTSLFKADFYANFEWFLISIKGAVYKDNIVFLEQNEIKDLSSIVSHNLKSAIKMTEEA
ncbi:MAG: hypothetical protein QXE05_03655 [Nitrososphaeria archaeon]